MRLFVGLEIPSVVRENLASLIRELRVASPQAKWIRPENLHVTLKFIGEVPPTKLEEIRAALSAVRFEQGVMLRVCGLGFFPGEKQPRVLWTGMDMSPNLLTIANDIDQRLGVLKIPRETRQFVPHLTLARFEPRGISPALRGAVEANAKREFGSLRANEFHLIHSKLKPSGAEYTTLASFQFAQDAQ